VSRATPTIEVVEGERLGAVAGAHVASAIAHCVQEQGRCRLGVAGGSSPRPALEWLAEHLAPELARRLVVTTIDERHLPLDDGGGLHPEHNLRMLNEAWIDRAEPPPAVLSMVRGGPLVDACRAYARAFAEELGGELDVLLLGVGPDGHVASLFPGHRGLTATGLCIAVPDSPKPPPERLTLTFGVLNATDVAVLVAVGAAKASVLARALAGDDSVPLARLAPRRSFHWVIDAAAASELPPS